MRGGSVALLLCLASCGPRTTNLVSKRLCAESAGFLDASTQRPDVAAPSALVLNGEAAAVDGVLRLIPALKNGVGSAYFRDSLAFDTTTSLFAHFAFRIGGGDGELGGDGLAFVLQSSAAGANALGLGGEGLGCKAVTPSIAIDFDTVSNYSEPDSDHIGLSLNCDPAAPLAFAVTPPLNDGVVRYVWIDYDGVSRELRVYMSNSRERPGAASLTHAGLDFSSVLGDAAFVGFSASSGEATNEHDVVGEAWFSPVAPGYCAE